MSTILDIETGPEDRKRVLSLLKPFRPFEPLGEFDPGAVKTGNRKDPEGIAACIEQARAKHAIQALAARSEYDAELAAYQDKAVEEGAKNPLTGRILAIGFRMTSGRKFILTAENDDQERDILIRAAGIVARHRARNVPIVGFRVFPFDVPFLYRRSMKYRICAEVYRAGRAWASVFRDLLDDWSVTDRNVFVSLDTLLAFFGLKPKTGHGSQFAALFFSDRSAAISYLENDLDREADLAVAMGVFDDAAVAARDEDELLGLIPAAADDNPFLRVA